SDEIKTEFTSREGTYKISSLIDNLGKIGTSTCLNEPVKITLLSRVQNICDTNSQTSSRRSSSINNNNDNSNEEKQLSLINGNELNQPNGSIFLTDILYVPSREVNSVLISSLRCIESLVKQFTGEVINGATQ
ncbi:unnamed protein product, partial [Rotaria sp. Silwood1]